MEGRAISEIAGHLSAILFNVSEAITGMGKPTLISGYNPVWQILYIQNLPSRRCTAKSPFPNTASQQSPQYHRRVLIVVLLTEQGKCPSLAGTGSWMWRSLADHNKHCRPQNMLA